MLLAIMVGVILITFFVADIVNRSAIDELKSEHSTEIEKIESDNENFTSNFIKANINLDRAREDRAYGTYHFDLAFLWYQSVLSEKNITNFELYKSRGIDNCTNAMPKYNNSYNNFDLAKEDFSKIKSYTKNEKYLEILDIYVNLTTVGSKLTNLMYNATYYLKYLIENLIFDIENGTVIYQINVSLELGLFYEILEQIEDLETEYDNIQKALDEYEFFEEER